MEKVSFVLAVKNGQDFVENTVNSFLNQTYQNIEVVTVNDHSEDKTLEILESMAKVNNKLMRLDASGDISHNYCRFVYDLL